MITAHENVTFVYEIIDVRLKKENGYSTLLSLILLALTSYLGDEGFYKKRNIIRRNLSSRSLSSFLSPVKQAPRRMAITLSSSSSYTLHQSSARCQVGEREIKGDQNRDVGINKKK